MCYLRTVATGKITQNMCVDCWRNDSDKTQTEILEEKLVPKPFYSPQIPHVIVWVRTPNQRSESTANKRLSHGTDNSSSETGTSADRVQ
jgi:hypothetical protein